MSSWTLWGHQEEGSLTCMEIGNKEDKMNMLTLVQGASDKS